MAPDLNTASDREMVNRSLRGDREAFGQIVARYQSLVCSLAYCGSGSLRESEDLAQEAFVTGWKQLRNLREPDKLRSWLCGITRRLLAHRMERRRRDVIQGAQGLETAGDLPAKEPSPAQQAISREEELVLWRAMEQMPIAYREPLVLFYREHQSVQSVAEALGLTEDAAKQRLSRGRRLLHEEVMAFVEGVLERTRPGKAFTLGVVAVLPGLATSASAATALPASGKLAAAATGGLTLSWLAHVLSPLIGFGAGCWVGIRNTKSPRERRFAIRSLVLGIAYVTAFLLLLFAWLLAGRRFADPHPVGFWAVICLLVLGYAIGLRRLNAWSDSQRRQIQPGPDTSDSP